MALDNVPSSREAGRATRPTVAAIDDDVKCLPPSGIDVLVVGGGIGGLTAAIELHRKGHSVRLLERSETASGGGDMFAVGLSARRLFKHYPEMARELDDISLHHHYLQYRKWTGETIAPPVPFRNHLAPAAKHLPEDNMPMVIQLQALYHDMLHHQIQRFGIEVVFDKKVVEYYEDHEGAAGGVVTADGQRIEADLVIAADGHGSCSRDLILGGQTKGKPAGKSVYRASMPLEVAMAVPEVKWTFGLHDGQKPLMQTWVGPDMHVMQLSYVDKHGQNGRIVWSLTFADVDDLATEESWHHVVSSDEVLRRLDKTPGWSEAFRALVRCTPHGSITSWPLVWRDPVSCVHSPRARVLQIGDAAHSFLPTSGNGATQAVEDAVTIAECLRQAGKDNITMAVRTHNFLRRDRVSCAQLLGFYNAERYHKAGLDKPELGGGGGGGGGGRAKVSSPKQPRWIWELDPEAYAEDNYAAAAASLAEDIPAFTNTNIPRECTPKAWSIRDIEQLHVEGNRVELEGDWS